MRSFESCAEAVLPWLARYRLEAVRVAPDAEIPGSYWGESEAGLIGGTLFYRADTPLHSVLHEASHYVCMDDARRARLDRDAGGDHAEEDAACYLQIRIAALIDGVGVEAMCRDMDAWGYTFRLGSARAWYEEDAAKARAWLIERGVLDEDGRPSGKLRQC